MQKGGHPFTLKLKIKKYAILTLSSRECILFYFFRYKNTVKNITAKFKIPITQYNQNSDPGAKMNKPTHINRIYWVAILSFSCHNSGS